MRRPMSAAVPFTAEQLLRLPRGAQRHQLVAGELCTMSPAGGPHGAIAFRLGLLVGTFVQARRLGTLFAAETGFLQARDPDTVLAPDLAFVARQRLDPAGLPPGYVTVVPDLVAEVGSPTDRAGALRSKARTWLDAGVQAVWLVHPGRRRVAVHRPGQARIVLAGDAALDGGEVLPGLRIPPRELFEP